MVNSIGDEVCRPAYRNLLVAYLAERADQLCAEHKDRFEENPMRLLDCKRGACVAATEHAPRLMDHLCEPCAVHFERVRARLDASGTTYEIETRLVRGQDYYTGTTFEFESLALEGAQLGLGGGGRYDGFAEALGGPSTPGIGFGLGVERLLLACQAEGVAPGRAARSGLDVFVIDTTGGEVARRFTSELRAGGIATDRAYDDRSFKAQMRSAIRSGARFALVAEPDGLTLRTLQEKGAAEPLTLETAVACIKERLAS